MRHPLQVYLDDRDLQRLEAWSRARGWTKSHAVRVAVRTLTRPRAEDPILELSGMVTEGLLADASTSFDRYLLETYVAEGTPAYRRRRRRPAARVRR